MALLAPLIYYLSVIKTPIAIEYDESRIGTVTFATTLFFFFPLLIVYAGFLNQTTYYNNVFDWPKQFGVLLSAADSHTMTIPHPFANGYNMIYYFFFYFKSAFFWNMSGMQASYASFPLTLLIESEVIVYAILFLFVQIGRFFNNSLIFIGFLLILLLIDGGWDSIYIFSHFHNIVEGGYEDGWARELYSKVGVSMALPHSNFLTKLIWQPQHVGSLVPFLLLIEQLFKKLRNEQKRTFTFICSVCVVSIIGYSALTFISFVFVVATIMTWLILSKAWNWRSSFYLGFGLVLSLPLVIMYASTPRPPIAIRLKDVGLMLYHYPLTTISNAIGDYGIIALMAIYGLFHCKKWDKEQLLALISCMVLGIMVVVLGMPGLNDLGMSVSFVFYMFLFILVLALNTELMLRKSILTVGLVVALLPGIYSNFQSLNIHITSNIPTIKQDSIMNVSKYMLQQHGNFGSSLYILSVDPNLNRHVPLLFHQKTFYPASEGQYLNEKDSSEIQTWIQKIQSASLEQTVEKLIKSHVHFVLTLQNSAESSYINALYKRIYYQDKDWIIYELT